MRALHGELPPPALAHRMQTALDGYRVSIGAAATLATPEVYLGAGELLLTRLIGADCTSRNCALDLLAADALVTYAFELAGDDPARIEVRAELATARFAALAHVAAPDR